VTYAAPGKQVARFAMRNDRTVFLLVFTTDQPLQTERFDRRSQKQLLHEHFDQEGWECARILAALDACEEVYLDEVTQIHMNSWSQGRVALVGDAAFCPSLLAGQGSALAMMAAYVLAGELSKRKAKPEAAFEHYARFLRRRKTNCVLASKRLGLWSEKSANRAPAADACQRRPVT
jgi:2-polyprenyl-6-methoxyphenol hydroxylase-like FAD-dependent oxidoreductase